MGWRQPVFDLATSDGPHAQLHLDQSSSMKQMKQVAITARKYGSEIGGQNAELHFVWLERCLLHERARTGKDFGQISDLRVEQGVSYGRYVLPGLINLRGVSDPVFVALCAAFLVPSPPRNDTEKASIHYVFCMSFLGGEGSGEGHAGATRRKRT
jgi:hypothetical protein